MYVCVCHGVTDRDIRRAAEEGVREVHELTMRLGNTQGGLPFTAAFDSDGRVVRRKLGETNFDELSGWAAAMR